MVTWFNDESIFLALVSDLAGTSCLGSSGLFWHNGRGCCEQHWMVDRFMVSGKLKRSMIFLSDINLKSHTWWSAKHNAYSCRGAIELLNIVLGFLPNLPLSPDAGLQAKVKSRVKEKIYAKFPASVRANFYYWYHYCFRFGFLDSRAGYFFHTLQPIWCRTLVDTKFSEVENLTRTRGISLPEAIQILSGIYIKIHLRPLQKLFYRLASALFFCFD